MKVKDAFKRRFTLMLGLFLFVVALFFGAVMSSDATQGQGASWTHGDWSSRVAWEARYALSQSANGISNFQTANNAYGQQWYGDWNYVASDSVAFGKAKSEAYDVTGEVSDDGLGHHRGGWCTFFVRLVLLRSTYWAFTDHYTTPAYPSSVYTITGAMTQNYSIMQPGWVLSKPSGSPQHMAIAESRATVNGYAGWWVIDANYVGGGGNYFIAKHFMPDYVLLSNGYYGWLPDRSSNN